VENAAKREAKEELSLEVEPIEILGVFSDPLRYPTGYILTMVFFGIVLRAEARGGDYSEEVQWVP